MNGNVDYDFVGRFIDWYGKAQDNVEKGTNLSSIKEEAERIIKVLDERISDNISKDIPTASFESLKNDMYYLNYRISEIE